VGKAGVEASRPQPRSAPEGERGAQSRAGAPRLGTPSAQPEEEVAALRLCPAARESSAESRVGGGGAGLSSPQPPAPPRPPAPVPRAALREGLWEPRGWGTPRAEPEARPGARGCRAAARVPGLQGQLTHRPLGLSSGGSSSSGGGGSAAPGAPGGEMLASAAASRPIPGSGGGGCGGRPASQAARPRPGPIPAPHPTSTPSHGPGAASRLHLGAAAGARRAGGRGGRGGEAELCAQRCPLPPTRAAPAPAPPPCSPLPSPASRAPRAAPRRGRLDCRLGLPLRASRVCSDQMCECARSLPVTVRAPAHGPGVLCGCVCAVGGGARQSVCRVCAWGSVSGCAWTCVCVFGSV
jgi:hypothetical protein